MENSKYYIPEESEFYIGFECEKLFFNDHPTFKGERIWYDKHIIDYFDFEDALGDFKEDLENRKFRVKYLDKEDIESLGWKYIEDLGWGLSYRKDENWLYTLFDNYQVEIDNGDINTFVGSIKNKNELKKLMKQIGIE